MRTRGLFLVALVSLPSVVMAQGIRLPRPSERTPVTPAPPSTREVPEVARALAYTRSRWSAEAYSMISVVQVPATAGGMTSYTTYGSGTHADYRYTNRWSATVDLTYSPLGGNATNGTAELGTRFRPMPANERVHPFFDLRGGFMHMSDRYAVPIGAAGSSLGYTDGQRYSRGFGGLVGTGLDVAATQSFMVTFGVAAVRNEMTSYRITTASLPGKTNYDLTSFRATLGIRYNAARALQLAQNPRS